MALPYWIEHDENGDPINFVWIKVPNLPAGKTIKLKITKTGSYFPAGDSVFDLFDDFEILDTNKWGVKTYSTGIVDVSNGILRLAPKSYTTNNASIYTLKTFKNNYEIVAYRKPTDEHYWDIGFSKVTSYATNIHHFPSSFGYALDVQSPVSGENNYDVYIYYGDYLAYVQSGGLTALNIYQRISAGYLSTGKLYFKNEVPGYPGWDISATNTELLNTDKYLVIFQGEYHTGFGGPSYVDWTFVRKATVNEPTVTVIDKDSYYEVNITNNEARDLTDYQVPIPIGDLGIASATESLKIVEDTSTSRPSIKIINSLYFEPETNNQSSFLTENKLEKPITENIGSINIGFVKSFVKIINHLNISSGQAVEMLVQNLQLTTEQVLSTITSSLNLKLEQVLASILGSIENGFAASFLKIINGLQLDLGQAVLNLVEALEIKPEQKITVINSINNQSQKLIETIINDLNISTGELIKALTNSLKLSLEKMMKILNILNVDLQRVVTVLINNGVSLEQIMTSIINTASLKTQQTIPEIISSINNYLEQNYIIELNQLNQLSQQIILKHNLLNKTEQQNQIINGQKLALEQTASFVINSLEVSLDRFITAVANALKLENSQVISSLINHLNVNLQQTIKTINNSLNIDLGKRLVDYLNSLNIDLQQVMPKILNGLQVDLQQLIKTQLNALKVKLAKAQLNFTSAFINSGQASFNLAGFLVDLMRELQIYEDIYLNTEQAISKLLNSLSIKMSKQQKQDLELILKLIQKYQKVQDLYFEIKNRINKVLNTEVSCGKKITPENYNMFMELMLYIIRAFKTTEGIAKSNKTTAQIKSNKTITGTTQHKTNLENISED